MLITVFGASGKTGKEIVVQALHKGYHINAFVRSPDKLKVVDPNIKLFVGDVLNPDTFGHALERADACIIALNGIMGEGIQNILAEMQKRKVRRLILMSSYPMSGSPEGMKYLKSSGMDSDKIAELMPVIRDKELQENLVKGSDLVWTIVRPTFLKDEEKTGLYETDGDKQFDASKHGINRSDVAEFMVNMLTTNEWDNKLVSITS
jgi:uncharacterized protein YbjT (DUF2867 family)